MIQARKLDLTTLGVATAHTTTQGEVNAGSIIPLTTFMTNNGGYSLSNGGIKIPASGIYEIEAQMSGSLEQNKGWIAISKNTVTNYIATGLNRNGSGLSYNSVHVSRVAVQLLQNDVVFLYTLDSISNVNGGLDGKPATFITVKKVA